MLVFGADEYVSRWVISNLRGLVTDFGKCAAIGVQKDGRLIAGVVYHEYRPEHKSIQMSVYAERGSNWLNRSNLAVFFGYPFNQLRCRSIQIACARNNKHAKKFVAKIGFRHAGLLRRGFGTVDAVLYDMIPEECKWSSQDGQGLKLRTASA